MPREPASTMDPPGRCLRSRFSHLRRAATAMGAALAVFVLAACGERDRQEDARGLQGSAGVDTLQVDTTRPCESCRIQIHHLSTFGGAEVRHDVIDREQVRTNDGRRFIALDSRAVELVVFDSTGRQAAILGGPGQGPGEFNWITAVFLDPNDSIVVIDEGLGRLSILGPDGDFARSVPLHLSYAQQFSHLRLPGGDFVLGGIVPTGDGIGYPLHRVSSDGALLASFGAETPSFDPRNEWAAHRVIAFDGQYVWATNRYQYELTAWDPETGVMHRVIQRHAPWFPRRDFIHERLRGDGIREPIITGLAADADGNLWVQIWKHDEHCCSGNFMADRRGQVTTIIEVIEIESGRLLARAETREVMRWLEGSLSPYSARRSSDGFSVWDVWRLELLRDN
jgi:hypothetical protein